MQTAVIVHTICVSALLRQVVVLDLVLISRVRANYVELALGLHVVALELHKEIHTHMHTEIHTQMQTDDTDRDEHTDSHRETHTEIHTQIHTQIHT